jgi:lipopolysaccharide/colanic/teichoic acid biosynthesis glycosyltransferase
MESGAMESLHGPVRPFDSVVTDAAEWSRPDLRVVHRPGVYETRVKPVIDIVLGMTLLVITAPLLISCMAMVRLFMGKPVVYRQTRVGLGGETFQLLKLRTMIPDRRSGNRPDYDGPERRQTHKSPHDPRVSRLGAALRAVRLDELPQLWNVVRGDMSLVGPRPELPEIVEQYEGWQHARHVVKPGLTGLWQVSAPKDKLMHECTDLDLAYIEDFGFLNDLKIIARTPKAMLRRHGF